MTEIVIDEFYSKGNTYPMIVNFQNGYPTDNLQSDKCLLLEDINNSRKSIATELNHIVYAGEEEEEDLGKNFILARNKNTGKVRLIEISNVDAKPFTKTDLEASQLIEVSQLELSRKFGSKKNKQYMEQREKLKVNEQTVSDQMQNVTQTITEDQLDLSSYNKVDSDDFYVPKINRDAKKVEDVYELDAILTTEEYEKIYSEIEETDYLEKLHPFLKSIVTSANKLAQQHSVLAVYANTLLTLYMTLMKEITKKSFIACPHSVTLNEIVINNFLTHTNNKYGRSPQYRDKSLCYAIVFIMLINNYKLDIEELCKQLKLTPRTVATKIAVTGATIVTNGSKKVAQLKLPLSKPALRRKSAKF
ncbi:hypothetical protein K1T71_000779 [Dendrolimus kikuchii]|uniref:Uncharacterized protein n=1 Tax=Dendrolimus kikuchii TaxID=765133 RepID=A0ACC1DKI9_9NEOP|nr:hypothetical protein K1T71_000779 [Dendrolimus kikuchii]